MDNSNKNGKTILLKSLSYVTKIISTAIIIVLILVGAFLIYYVVSAQILSKAEGGSPKLSLFTIVSGSMQPVIKVYDVILDVRIDDPKDVKVGDVITFISTSSISKDMRVTHRVLDIKIVDGKYEFVTKGDHNPTADSDTAKEANLVGKTILKIPQLGRIQFFLATKMGWFIVVLVPALGVIIFDILKLFKIVGVKKSGDKLETKTDVSELQEKADDKKIAVAMEKIKKQKRGKIENPPSEAEASITEPENSADKEITETNNPVTFEADEEAIEEARVNAILAKIKQNNPNETVENPVIAEESSMTLDNSETDEAGSELSSDEEEARVNAILAKIKENNPDEIIENPVIAEESSATSDSPKTDEAESFIPSDEEAAEEAIDADNDNYEADESAEEAMIKEAFAKIKNKNLKNIAEDTFEFVPSEKTSSTAEKESELGMFMDNTLEKDSKSPADLDNILDMARSLINQVTDESIKFDNENDD